MTELHAALASQVAEWRNAGYPHDRYPAISEILGYAPGPLVVESGPGV